MTEEEMETVITKNCEEKGMADMSTEDMIRELRRLEEKHKDDHVPTFAVNWSLLCHDVANRLEELNNKLNG